MPKNNQKGFLIIKSIVIYYILVLINDSKIIQINNVINEPMFQVDKDFSKYDTKYKVLVIYYPLNYNITKEPSNQYKTKSDIKKLYEINFEKSIIEKQVKLSKNHGIFGFGIIYDFTKLNDSNLIINFFAFDNDIHFPFLIIFNFCTNFTLQYNDYLNRNITYQKSIQSLLIISIKNYFKSKNYIKIKGKYALGIVFSSLTKLLINYIRKYEIANKEEKFFIISISFGKSEFHSSNLSKTIDSIVEFPSQNIGFENFINKRYFYNFYFQKLYLKENIISKNIDYFFIVNGCLPEKFYLIFKVFLNITKQEEGILLFNAWNNYKENSFLAPNSEFGFSYLNYFSKAVFNINDKILYELDSLNNECKIAVQIHLFYNDLTEEIVNKVNNIPVKFDLFITTTSLEKYIFIINYIKKYSKANYFEVLIVENKGRDILPFLKQIKGKFRKYKYICHIHSKKSKHSKTVLLGVNWRKYLLNNLLGNSDIVSNILQNFEKNKKLGFIFPEAFYGIIKPFFLLTNGTKSWMNFLAKKFFPNYKIGKLLNFPAGNMFWAKIDAIFQIFIYDLSKYFPKENNQTNDTIMHGIERFWLYLVRFNHFYYKSIFKFF